MLIYKCVTKYKKKKKRCLNKSETHMLTKECCLLKNVLYIVIILMIVIIIRLSLKSLLVYNIKHICINIHEKILYKNKKNKIGMSEKRENGFRGTKNGYKKCTSHV